MVCIYSYPWCVSTKVIDMKKKTENLELVEIQPIEYQFKMPKHKNPRILRYRELSFTPNLTQAILNRIIAKTRMKKKASAHQNPDRYIFYQYGQEPQIILDMLTRKILVTKGTFEQFGERKCQQQASILMRILKEHGYAHFTRKSVTVNPNKIGKTAEDRKTTYRACKYLFNDPID
jgi:hypothetical protein